MVEEHSASVVCRIETDYPASAALVGEPTTTASSSCSQQSSSLEDRGTRSVDTEDVHSDNRSSPGHPESPKPGCSIDEATRGDQTLAVTEEPCEDREIGDEGAVGTITAITGPAVSCIAATASAIRPVSFISNPVVVARRLKQENERLQAELTRLRRLVITAGAAVGAHRLSANNSEQDAEGELSACGSSQQQPQPNSLEAELQLAREALSALRSDRKRLKAEKFDLLNQMKQLYATLEDKEKELRDFIRNYEQRVRESDASLQQLSTEREERERERWSLLRHARDEAERSLSLAAQLNAKELQLQQAQEQLREARRQLVGCCLSDQERGGGGSGPATTPGSLAGIQLDRGSCSADSGVVRGSETTSAGGNLSDSTTDGTPTITVDTGLGNAADMDTISVVSSVGQPHHVYQLVSTPKDCSPTLSPLNANNFSRSVDTGILSRSVEQLSSPLDSEPVAVIAGRRSSKNTPSRTGGGRGGTWGSISRVFARSRHRNKSNSLHGVSASGEASAIVPGCSQEGQDSYRSWSPLTEEGYAEKLRLLREASSVPMERWRAPTVLAWLEIALGMPQYGPRCAENVKSGKVLLELSDLELECGLGIAHPMHRKKLRLAIEEHRHPSLVRYPCIAQLGHTWVSSEWLPDLGLAQYSENFATNMVDARMLEHLSKKELEKFLGVTRKFHQASVVHGIHLLRIMKYDRQALAVRRHQCETVDADPLVWSNQRFVRWARNIDLGEYADNLKDSGVHGGLVVLEPSFNGDTMATALGIPPSKNIIRRHLTAELEALVLPARSMLEHVVRVRGTNTGTVAALGRSYSRSCAAGLAGSSLPGIQQQESLGPVSVRASIRGSLSRALGLSFKSDREKDKQSPTSGSESSSVVSRISPTVPCAPGCESPVYSAPFSFRHSAGAGSSGHGFLGQLASVAGGSLPRNRRYHRRVRSISEIDVKPVSSPV